MQWLFTYISNFQSFMLDRVLWGGGMKHIPDSKGHKLEVHANPSQSAETLRCDGRFKDTRCAFITVCLGHEKRHGGDSHTHQDNTRHPCTWSEVKLGALIAGGVRLQCSPQVPCHLIRFMTTGVVVPESDRHASSVVEHWFRNTDEPDHTSLDSGTQTLHRWCGGRFPTQHPGGMRYPQQVCILYIINN